MLAIKRAALAATAVIALATLAAPASAGEFTGKKAGDIVVRARALDVVPAEKGDIKAGGADTGLDVTVGTSQVPELDLSYFVTDNIAVEVIAGTTKHNVGIKQGGDLGSVRLLPPTVTAQYHFLPKSQFSPYVGLGLNYTLFYDEKAGSSISSIDYKNGFGVAAQAGFDYFIDNNWLVNVDVKKLWLSTDVKVNGGALTSKVDLNPWVLGVGLGYKF